MVPTTHGTLIDMIMQRLGMGAPDGSVPGGPPPMRGTFDANSAQPGSMALNPLQMPTQAPPGLQAPQLDPQSQFTRPSDAAPLAVPPLGEARTPAAVPPMGIPYEAPAPQREAVMTQDADRSGPAPAPAARKAPESGFLSNAAQFVSGMRTGGLITDLAGGYKAVENRNATREFLTQKGLAPETISAMEADPRIFQPVMADLFSSKTQVINNKLVESRTGRVIADFSDAATKGPDVKDVYNPDGSRGTVRWDARKQDFVPISTGGADVTGSGMDQKKFREVLAQKTAERVATAQTSLPSTLNMIDDQIRLIDKVAGDKNLTKAIGPYNSRLPTWANPDAADVQAVIAQLGGGAFLQAIPQIKGTGPMSNAEGERAMIAINRLQKLDQSDPGYKEALREAKDSLVRLRDVAQREAKGDFTPRPASQLPEGMTADQVKAEAKAAIARGKDPGAVRSELSKFGLSLD